MAKKQINEEVVEDINVMKEVFNIVLYIWVLIICIFLINTFIGMRTVVEGPSMNDTLYNGESLWVDKLAYRFGKPERYDIVVFPVYHEDYVYYVKRVIGLPGETVSLDGEGRILINGQPIEDRYAKENIDNMHIGRLEKEITLDDDEYFVLGDNRNNSTDSRDERVGNVKDYELTGRVSLRVYPFNKFGKIED